MTLDRHARRRKASLELGASVSLDCGAPAVAGEVLALLRHGNSCSGADLTYELSGSPPALDQAIAVTGFDGRVVIGSWYGQRQAQIELGSRFHRSRIQIISSQVSTIAPALSGRWSKPRRFGVALDMLLQIKPSRFITHRFPLSRAHEAYRLLDKDQGQAIQVVFTYHEQE